MTTVIQYISDVKNVWFQLNVYIYHHAQSNLIFYFNLDETY